MQQQALELTVKGMVCGGCEDAVERAVKTLHGVAEISASHVEESVKVLYDPSKITSKIIIDTITKTGYQVLDGAPSSAAAQAVQVQDFTTQPSLKTHLHKLFIFIVLLLVVGGIVQWGRSLMPEVMGQLSSGLALPTLFVLGFLTGFHCIGMCGSFVVSYVEKSHTMAQSAMSHLAYGSGKTLSYSLLGACFGFLGALITVTPAMRGYAALFAGVFLFLFGLKMLNLIPKLRLLNVRFPKAMTAKVTGALGRTQRPFVVGLLNGLLLGCGPLQAMYILAAGTGSPVEGALMLCVFGLGTLPALLGFGLFASYLSAKSIHQIMRVSGVLVILMGGMMLSRGINLLSATPGMMGN